MHPPTSDAFGTTSRGPAAGTSGGPVPQRRSGRVVRLALIVSAVLGIVVGSATTSVWAAQAFSDVPASHVFHNDIAWLARSGIAEGYTDGTFRPTDPVSRQAMAAFLRRSMNSISTRSQNFSTEGATVHVVVVDCPGGKRPIAGGGRIVSATSGSNPVLLASGPTVQGDQGWTVSWRTSKAATVHGQGQVTCVPA